MINDIIQEVEKATRKPTATERRHLATAITDAANHHRPHADFVATGARSTAIKRMIEQGCASGPASILARVTPAGVAIIKEEC